MKMKRFIRDKSTGRFLTNEGLWTENREDALVFSNIKDLCAALQRYDLKDVESVLTPTDGLSKKYDVVVPLPFLDPATGLAWAPRK